jgi:hypothetical protein
MLNSTLFNAYYVLLEEAQTEVLHEIKGEHRSAIPHEPLFESFLVIVQGSAG